MGERLTRVRAWMLVTAAALVAGLALPAASHAANEITEATPNAINQTFDFEAGELILRGTADADVTGVQVTLDDADDTTAPITLPADLVAGSDGSTWTRVFSGLAVRNLEDGTLTASARYAVGGTEVMRTERTILKDLQAPAAPPTALPASSYFNLDLDVRLTAEPGETIHCTLDGTAPTAATPPCLGSITVTGTTTIRALAADAAGNAGPEAAFTYTLDDDAPVTTVDVPAGFHATPVPVTLTATDAGSGVEATWYTTNGDDPRDAAGSRAVYDPDHKPTLTDGQRLQFASEDRAGNMEQPQLSAAAQVDTTTPATSDDVDTAWHGGPVTVTLTATDTSGSGVAKTYYTTDGSLPSEASSVYSETAKPTLSHGERIKYFSVDEVGNAEAVQTSLGAQVDTTRPATSDDVPTAWRGGPVEVTLTAADADGSGVAKTYYTTDGSVPSEASSVYSETAKPKLEHGQRIKYFSVDEVRNVEAVNTSAAAQVDATAPETTDNVDTAWHDGPAEVTLSATDTNGSGVAKTYYTTDGSDPTTASSVYSASAKPKLNDGERVKYFSVDTVGNTEAVQTSVAAKVDTAKPVTSDDVDAAWHGGPVEVTLSAGDAGGSGVATTYYTTDGSDPTTASAVYTDAAKPKLNHGEGIKYFSIDAVGNREAVQTSPAAKVDTAKPATSDDVDAAWHGGPVTVTLTATDTDGSGVATTYYTTDGSDPTTAGSVYSASAKPKLNDGERVKYFSVDSVGNTEAPKTSATARVDTTKPATSDDVDTAWHGGPVTVTLTATDTNGSGVAKTYYTTDGSDPTTDSAVYSATAKPELDHGERIKYFSIDAVGNREAVQTSLAAKVDTTTPATTDDATADWRGGPVTVTLTATDANGSGVDKTYYTTDDSDPTIPTNPGRKLYSETAKPTLGHGERVKYYSVDTIGNTEAVNVSAVARVDTTTPVTQDDVPATWHRAPVTVTLTASDTGGSGVATTYYTTDGSIPSEASSVYSDAAKPTLNNGERIKYFSVDQVGNAEPVQTSAAARVDTTKPVTTDDVTADWHGAEITVTLTATDAGGSDVATTYYTTDGSDPTDPNNDKRATYSATAKPKLSHGEQIRYASVDGAGNVEATKTSATAQVDTTEPATTDEVDADWHGGPVTVTLTAADLDGSGVAKTYYTTDGTVPTEASSVYSAAAKPKLDNGERVKYFSVDEVGNAEAVKVSGAARVDILDPRTTDDVDANWHGGPVTVTLTAADPDGSGVAATYYTTDGSDPTEASTLYSATAKPKLSHGERVKYFSVDHVGHAEAIQTSAAAKVDTTKPATSDDVDTSWHGATVTVTLTATDANGSGVATTYYTTDGSVPTEASSVYSTTAKPKLNHGERIKYFSVDEVGNAEAVQTSAAAQVDTTTPVTEDDVPAEWQKADVTVTLTATDTNGSGPAETWYTTDGSSPTDTSNPSRRPYGPTSKPKLRDGERVRYYSVDNAGNAEAVQTSAPAKVDTIAPSTADDVPATWQKADVPVTLSASDAGSGAAETWYTTDGTNPADAGNANRKAYRAEAKPVLAHGQSLRYASVDALGNVEAAKTTAVAKVDKEVPATTDNVPASFQTNDVTVTLARNDTGGSGVATTWYTTDGSDPSDASNAKRAPYSATAKPTLGDGQRIRYATVDVAGNVEAVRTSATAKVDKVAPATTDDVPAAWQKADVTVTLSATDGAGSGVATTWYTTDGSDPTLATNLARQPYDPAAKPVLGPGQKIRYFSVDRMNNREATKETAAKVDQTAPATTDNVPLGWRTADIPVTLTANDTGVGIVAGTWYTLDGSDPTDPANPARHAYTAAAKPTLGAGQRIRYASTDSVGNVEGVRTSLAAKVDTTAPATTDDVPAAPRAGDVAVTLTAADTGGSGIAQTWFTTDGSDPTVAANPVRRLYGGFVRPVLGDGEQVRYYSIDAAGNAEPVRTSRAATVTGAPTTPSTPASTPATPAPTPAPAPPPAEVVAAPAASPAPAPSPAEQPAGPRLGGVTVAPVLSRASVRAAGVPVTVKVPAGAKVLQIQVVKAGAGARAAAAAKARPLATLYRFPKRAGTLRTNLATAALKRLKPGSYQLVVRAGATKRTLGAATVKRFRVRS